MFAARRIGISAPPVRDPPLRIVADNAHLVALGVPEVRAIVVRVVPGTQARPAFSRAAVGKRHGMSKRGNRFLRQATGMAIVSEPDNRILKRNFFPYER